MIKSILHTSHKKDRGGKNPHDGVKSIFSDLLVQLGETFDMHSIIEPYSGGFTGITGWSRQKDAVWAAMSIIVQRLSYVKEGLWSQESHFSNYHQPRAGLDFSDRFQLIWAPTDAADCPNHRFFKTVVLPWPSGLNFDLVLSTHPSAQSFYAAPPPPAPPQRQKGGEIWWLSSFCKEVEINFRISFLESNIWNRQR